MLLLGSHLLLIPSVLDVDVNPPIRVLFGERFSPPKCLSAVGEDGGLPVLMFDGTLPACVLIGEDVVAVGVFHISSPASLRGMPLSFGLWAWTPNTQLRRILLSRVRGRGYTSGYCRDRLRVGQRRLRQRACASASSLCRSEQRRRRGPFTHSGE